VKVWLRTETIKGLGRGERSSPAPIVVDGERMAFPRGAINTMGHSRPIRVDENRANFVTRQK